MAIWCPLPKIFPWCRDKISPNEDTWSFFTMNCSLSKSIFCIFDGLFIFSAYSVCFIFFVAQMNRFKWKGDEHLKYFQALPQFSGVPGQYLQWSRQCCDLRKCCACSCWIVCLWEAGSFAQVPDVRVDRFWSRDRGSLLSLHRQLRVRDGVHRSVGPRTTRRRGVIWHLGSVRCLIDALLQHLVDDCSPLSFAANHV